MRGVTVRGVTRPRILQQVVLRHESRPGVAEHSAAPRHRSVSDAGRLPDTFQPDFGSESDAVAGMRTPMSAVNHIDVVLPTVGINLWITRSTRLDPATTSCPELRSATPEAGSGHGPR